MPDTEHLKPIPEMIPMLLCEKDKPIQTHYCDTLEDLGSMIQSADVLGLSWRAARYQAPVEPGVSVAEYRLELWNECMSEVGPLAPRADFEVQSPRDKDSQTPSD